MYLVINTDQYKATEKARRYIQIKAEVYLPCKPSKKTRSINGRNCRQRGLEREAARQGVEVIKVNPAYTSIIGRYKYQKQFGLTVHQSAALVIGRRGYRHTEKLPKSVRDILPQKVKEKNKHHWSQWHEANKTIIKLRKAGVKPAFLVA